MKKTNKSLFYLIDLLLLLTSTEELHDEPEFILYHEGGVVGDDVGVAALAHGLDLFLLCVRKKKQVESLPSDCLFISSKGKPSFPFPDRI